MNTDFVNKVEKDQVRTDLPAFDTGDTINVSYKIVDDGGKTRRVQDFKGIVLAIKHSGTRKTFTVRKIASAGVGVERIFPLNSPNIDKIEVIKRGKTRKSKLYYMRDRIGKAAMKIGEKDMSMEVPVEGVVEKETEEVAESEK